MLTRLDCDLPLQISSIRREILDLDLQIQRLKLNTAKIDRQIDTEVAFDPDLKNDSQRRSRKAELEEKNPALQEMQELLIDLKSQRESRAIDLEYLTNQFSQWKIEQRLMIASMLLDSNE